MSGVERQRGSITVLCDCSAETGLGHIRRTNRLCRALSARGMHPVFLLPPDSMADRHIDPAFRTSPLRLSLAQRECAEEIVERVRSDASEMILVDSCRLAGETLLVLNRDIPSVPVFAFDDFGRKPAFPLRGVIHPGLGAIRDAYGLDAGPDSAVGPEYALIDADCVRPEGRTASQPRRLLVTVGGSDPDGMLPRLVRLLASLGPSWRKEVLLGPLHGHDPELEAMADADARLALHYAPADHYRLMGECDAAITAAGLTCLELLHLGVPVLGMALNESQEPAAEALQRLGCGVNLGRVDHCGDRELEAAILDHLGDEPGLERRAHLGRELVDGRGAERLADHLRNCLDRYHGDLYTQTEVCAEYAASAASPEDYAKARWGSDAGMRHRFRVVQDRIRWEPDLRWLDIGCATGALYESSRRNCLFGFYQGLDVCQEMVDQARLRHGSKAGVRFDVGSLGDYRPTTPFDLVSCLGVLQKCGLSLDKGVARLAEMTVPGGQVVVTTKNRDWKAFDQPGFDPYPHHHWFRLDALRSAFRLAGLAINDLQGFDTDTGRLVEPEESHSVVIHAVKERPC